MIFERALRLSGLSASEALFVGDTPAYDIDGAAEFGMRTVLIRAEGDVAMSKVEPKHVADHVIEELPEFLGIV